MTRSLLHLRNALRSIYATLTGTVISVSPVHPAKVLASMPVICSGMVIAVSFVQSENAPTPMRTTSSGIVISSALDAHFTIFPLTMRSGFALLHAVSGASSNSLS